MRQVVLSLQGRDTEKQHGTAISMREEKTAPRKRRLVVRMVRGEAGVEPRSVRGGIDLMRI